jgi:hypothetical protein
MTCVAFWVAVAWVTICVPIHAHEIGATQVAASFTAETYVVDVTVDPDALLTLLWIRAGRQIETVVDRAARDRRIEELAPVFLDSIDLRFDGARTRPGFEYRPASATAGVARQPLLIRLTGRHPAASKFTISYPLASGSFAMTVRFAPDVVRTIWLEGGVQSAPVALDAGLTPTRLAVASRYFQLGFEHVVPRGFNHVLLVLGAFFVGGRRRSIVTQFSAFTVSHAIAVLLTVCGLVSVPLRVVEPLIALSAAFFAAENLLSDEVRSWRLTLIFVLGLLHGMGFAGVLRELELPRAELLTALTSFNVGVEAAQLALVAFAIFVVGRWRRTSVAYRSLVVQPASLVIAVAGVYWIVSGLM